MDAALAHRRLHERRELLRVGGGQRAQGSSLCSLSVVAPAGLEGFLESTAKAGGVRVDDAFDRFGGIDLTVVGPPLSVSHPG